ncbi:MAG: deoxyribose-phosphate aldolase [Clostridiales bacterium]|nr:deoxyribose-phosphate aldolase [Clostridiales bacterium]
MEERNIAKYIDHTLLKANATEAQIRRLCEEAREYHFASVCVNTCYVPLAAELLKGSGVKTCCVVGFPLGAMSTAAKAFEAADAVKNGAEEVDMVINIGAVKFGDWDYVAKDIEEVVKASHDKALVKVIIETCLLTDDEKVLACRTAKEAGADFVKTSTGFSIGGATVEDIRLMRETVGAEMGVKASGGIKTYEDAIAMIEAGATRIGASSGIAIVEGAQAKE